jgi:hypothetical protein
VSVLDRWRNALAVELGRLITDDDHVVCTPAESRCIPIG